LAILLPFAVLVIFAAVKIAQAGAAVERVLWWVENEREEA